jgi:hypothetical protein
MSNLYFFPLDAAIVLYKFNLTYVFVLWLVYVDYSTLTRNFTLLFSRPFDNALFSHRNIILHLFHCAACLYRLYTSKIVILNYIIFTRVVWRAHSPQPTTPSPQPTSPSPQPKVHSPNYDIWRAFSFLYIFVQYGRPVYFRRPSIIYFFMSYK